MSFLHLYNYQSNDQSMSQSTLFWEPKLITRVIYRASFYPMFNTWVSLKAYVKAKKKKCLVVLLWSKTDRVGRSDFYFILFLFFYLSYGLVEAKEAKQVIKTTFNVKGCYMVGLLNTYMQLYSNMNAQKIWIRIQWLPLAAMDLSSVMKPLPSKLPYLPEVSSSRTL